MGETEIAPGIALGAERYTLVRWLGSGGMASVWLARDELLTRQVAVKVMADTLAFDARYRERFGREARAAASVSHPSIVPVYDFGLHGERPFLVMEYVSGGSLADVLAGRAAVLPDPGELACELLGALECVHGAGLVHRDVKPANILLDAAGHARLTDFGIAQPEDSTSLTQTGMVIGSIRYLAPEVAAGERASVAADLYAAGVVLRELGKRCPAPRLTHMIEALTRAAPDARPASAAAALALLATRPQVAPEPTAPTRVAPEPTAPTRVAPGPTAPTRVAPEPTAPTRVAPGPTAPTRVAPGPTAPTRVAPEPTAPTRVAPASGTGSVPPASIPASSPAPTRVAPAPAPSPTRVAATARPARPADGRRAAPTSATRAGGSLAIHVSPRAVVLAAAAVLVLVLVVILSASGGGTPSPARAATSTTGPASASAGLADQLSSLEKVVDHAAGR